jgi:hypothetical protein
MWPSGSMSSKTDLLDHPLRLFRHEDLGYWGVTEVFGPMWLARGLGLYSRESNLEVMKLQF